MSRLVAIVGGALVLFAAASCGGGGRSNGRATTNLWVFDEPSGAVPDAVRS